MAHPPGPGPHDGGTTVAVQRCLDALDAGAPTDAVVRELLGRSVRRLELLCGRLLHASYPRLARAPLHLETEDLLAAVVERLIKALGEVRPRTVRQFFGLANQHLRWELNDLARRVDEHPAPLELPEAGVAAPAVTDSGLDPGVRRLLDAIDGLPDTEREVFELLRVQGLTHVEAADVLGVSTKTVQRRAQRALLLLTDALDASAAQHPAS